MTLQNICSMVDFMCLQLLTLQNICSRVGISYYDSSIRQLHALEVWEDGSKDFPLVDLGMSFKFFFLWNGLYFF